MNAPVGAPADKVEPMTPIVSTGWLSANSTFDAPRKRKLGGAFGVSIALHLGLFALIAFVWAVTPQDTLDNLQNQIVQMVYLQQPGPGGGGGGSQAPAPPKPIEVPKHKMPDPPPVVAPPPVAPPPPQPVLNAPIMTPNADLVQATGTSSVSLANYGGGGRGTGIGPGQGSGVGPGTNGGFGGGAYQIGNGISAPSIVRQTKPNYTPDAMKAKIQGDVTLEAVVMPDGTVGDVRVIKSLDKRMGLDDEAIKAAKLWLFNPGKDRGGKPVPVMVTLILSFRMY
jgi:TonB family protein